MELNFVWMQENLYIFKLEGAMQYSCSFQFIGKKIETEKWITWLQIQLCGSAA